MLAAVVVDPNQLVLTLEMVVSAAVVEVEHGTFHIMVKADL
jgi:hypothetical protein